MMNVSRCAIAALMCKLPAVICLLAAIAINGCSDGQPDQDAPSLPTGSRDTDIDSAPTDETETADPGSPNTDLDSLDTVAATGPIRPVVEIIDSLDDGVVLITTRNALQQDTATGSGFVIDRRGLVATNYHVLSQAVSAVVQFRDGRTANVVGVRGFDPERDLAVIEIDTIPSHLEVFKLTRPARLQQGEELIAIGHPAGFEFTVSTGIVSAVRKASDLPEQYQQGRNVPEDTVWVQSSAAISAGSSGGPLLNRAGQVVGINSWVAYGENLGFAVHVQHLIDLAKQLDSSATPLPLPGLGLVTNTEVAGLILEFNQAWQLFVSEHQDPQTGLVDYSKMSGPNPRIEHGQKLIRFAEKTDDLVAGIEATVAALQIANDLSSHSQAIRTRCLELAGGRFFDHPRLADLAFEFGTVVRPETRMLLQRMIDETPHPTVQGVACLSLHQVMTKLDASRLDLFQPDKLQALERIDADFADVFIRGFRLGSLVEEDRHRLRHLVVNQPAPETVGTSISGVPLSLSQLRGKAVLLAFSVDVSPECRKLYGVLKELQDHYGPEKLAVVTVSRDDEVTLRRLVNQKTITWHDWHDGPQGEIATAWQVKTFPTVYGLERHGRVQFSVVGKAPKPRLQALTDLLVGPQYVNCDLVPMDSTWQYHADGTALAQNWMLADFDDSAWKSGRAPLGFGWGNEATQIAPTRLTTAYFRHEFEVGDPTGIQHVLLQHCSDDAVAVYLNGQEIARTNLRDDADHDALAANPMTQHGYTPQFVRVPPELFVEGRNVLAAEVHQEHPASADLRFQCGLQMNGLSQLIDALSDPSQVNRSLLIRALAGLESDAQEAVDRLVEFIDGERADLLFDALLAIEQIDPERAAEIELPPHGDDDFSNWRGPASEMLSKRCWSIIRQDTTCRSDYENALTVFRTARKLSPSIRHWRLIKAMCLVRLQRYDEARQALAEGELFRMDYAAVERACLAICLARSGQLNQARLVFKSIKPEELESFENQQDGLQMLYEEAREAISQAPAEDDKSPEEPDAVQEDQSTAVSR